MSSGLAAPEAATRRLRACRVALTCAVALGPCAAPGEAQPGGRTAGGFQTVLWWNDGLEPTARRLAAVRDLGFRAVSVSAEQDPAVPGRHALRFYRDQVAGKGILELRDGPWTERRDAYERSRDPADLVRPHCLSAPATIEELRAVLSRRLRAALPEHPIAVSLGDEISVTRHGSPLDFCTSPFCLREFRTFLLRRHGGLAALNRAWGAGFVAMDDVIPFTADRIRARELGGETLPRNLRPWSEHLEFMDQVLAGVIEGLTARVARLAPGLPCGLTGMQPPSAYGGHDYRLLMPHCTFYEAYDIGGARDLAMSLAPPGALQVATVAAPARDMPVHLARARCFDLVAHGLSGIVVWSARQVLDSEDAPTPFGRELGRTFELLQPVADLVAGAELVRSPVWIAESQAAVRAHWMLDSIDDGRTWIRRLPSYEREHSTSQAARLSWVRMFEDLGLQARLVPAEVLPRRLAADPPRLLVLPALLALSDEAAAAIERYVEAGGVALADHGLGFYDESLRRRETPVLDRLFGLRGRSAKLADLLVRQGVPDPRGRLASGAAAAEAGLSGDLAEPAGPFRVHLEHARGRGRAVYLNLAVCEYGRARLDPQRVATALDLRRRVRRVAFDAGLRPPAAVEGEGLPTCVERIDLRTRDGRRVLAIRLNALDSPALMRELGERGARPLTLSFPEPVRVVDLLSGRAMGPAARFELQLGPWVGLLLEILDAD